MRKHPTGTMRRKYSHFSREERQALYEMRSKGKSLRAIAVHLGRGKGAVGSVSREIMRNKHPFPVVEKGMSPSEKAADAQRRADERWVVAEKHKSFDDDELRRKVIELITQEQASPRDVALRIAKLLPGKSIAERTIYYSIKRDRQELQKHLRLRGKPRRQHVTQPKRRKEAGLPPKRSIDERPWHVEARVEYGHFETDSILSCKNGSGWAILTIRELKSRKRFYFLVTNLKTETINAVLLGFFRSLPPHMRKSLTVDNGSEFEHLFKVEEAFPGFLVYYCHPYCPCERGAVENANGELRWYYPKGTDFSAVSPHDLFAKMQIINRRCMDCLAGESAEEVFARVIKNPPRAFSFPTTIDIRQYSGSGVIEKIDARVITASAFAPPVKTESGIWIKPSPLIQLPSSVHYAATYHHLKQRLLTGHYPVNISAATLHWTQNQAAVQQSPVRLC
jgi:transposase, IS30 family